MSMDTRKEVLFVLIQSTPTGSSRCWHRGCAAGLAYGNRDTKSEPWLPMRGR